MSYKIYAEIIDPETGKKERGTGSYEGSEDTRQKALAGARQLRKQGFTVTVTGPDDRPLEPSD